MQVAGVGVIGLRAPVLDRLRQLLPVRAVSRGPASRRTQAVRRRRGAGSGRAPRAPSRCRTPRRGPTAAPRTIRSGRRRPAWRPTTRPGEAACGRARKSRRAGRRKRRCAHGGRVESGSGQKLTWNLGQRRSQSSGHPAKNGQPTEGIIASLPGLTRQSIRFAKTFAKRDGYAGQARVSRVITSSPQTPSGSCR